MSSNRIRKYSPLYLAINGREKYTIDNEMLWQINNHPDFEQWQYDGKLPGTLVSDLCKSLKTDPLYVGQPNCKWKLKEPIGRRAKTR